MREKTLEFFRRVLPKNHPDIGENHPDIGEDDAVYGGARIAFHACDILRDVQARPWVISPTRTLTLDDTKRRLRCGKRRWNSSAVCLEKIILI
jgi:hypothetical protein